MVSGNLGAQAISLITAPVLYRIYEKEHYGILGLFMAFNSILTGISTLQYNQAIILEKTRWKSLQLMWLNRIVNLAWVFIILLLVAMFGPIVANRMNSPDLSIWLWLLPLSVFLTAHNEILRLWGNRHKAYNALSIHTVLTAVLIPLVSISLGLVVNSPLGLIAGLLSGQLIPAIYLACMLKPGLIYDPQRINWTTVKTLANQHKRFPLLQLPSEFINRFSNQLPVFILGHIAGPAVVGSYNLCIRMLGLPLSLVSGSVAEVYRQKATEDHLKAGSSIVVFRKTLRTLSGLGLLPFLILILWGPDIFALVFGAKWRDAGIFAQILGGLYYLRFIISPLSYVYFIRGKLQENLVIHIWMLLSTLFLYFLTLKAGWTELQFLFWFGLNYGLIYLFYLYRSYRLSLPDNS